MSSNGFFAHQRNTHGNANANAGTTLKRRGVIGGFQEERNRYTPPQKRARSQTQTHGRIPLYHGSNVSRVSNYGDVIGFNSSSSFPFALRNNDSSPSNTDYQKPSGYGNPNPQLIPFPLPYRKLNDDVSFDSLPEWVPNESVNRSNLSNFPIRSTNLVPNIAEDRFNAYAPAYTNLPNSMPMNHSNMISIVSQAMPQPIVSKDISDLLDVLSNEKQNSDADESPLGLDFDPAKLKVRHESVIKSLYSDMPRQCSSCGMRFKCQEDHSNHMDWHVRKNRMVKDANKTSTRLSQKPNKSRAWFASKSLWLTAATGGATEAPKAGFNVNQKKEEEEDQERVVPADENQKTCALCVEPFEEFFSHEADEWMYKDAVYLNMEDEDTKLGPIVHFKCMPETRPGDDSSKSMVMSVTVPSVASALVC